MIKYLTLLLVCTQNNGEIFEEKGRFVNLSNGEFREKDSKVLNWISELNYDWLSPICVENVTEETKTLILSTETKIKEIYEKARICPFKDPGCSDNHLRRKDFITLKKTANNEPEMKYLWKEWRQVTGKKIKEKFLFLSKLKNDLNCSSDNTNDLISLWSRKNSKGRSLELLYKHLHSFCRKKLINFYTDNVPISQFDTLAEHMVTNNIWSHSWSSLCHIVDTSNSSGCDLSLFLTSIKDFNRTQTVNYYLKISEKIGFELSESLKVSKGYKSNEELGDLLCSPEDDDEIKGSRVESSALLCNSKYRHGIIGALNLVILSSALAQSLDYVTPKEKEEGKKKEISFLLGRALQTLPLLSSALALNSWSQIPKRGSLNESLSNENWWRHQEEFCGISPPTPRSEEDFDPGFVLESLSLVFPSNHFAKSLLQFQIYEKLCNSSNNYNHCDSTQKDIKSKNVLSNEFLDFPLSEKPLLRYFEKLYDYLERENRYENNCIGWKGDCEEHGRNFIDNVFSKETRRLQGLANQKEWEFNTNINNYTIEEKTKAYENYADFEKEMWKQYFTQYAWKDFKDPSLKRRFSFRATIGSFALSNEKYGQLNALVTEMESLYSSGKVCPYLYSNCSLSNEGLALDPDLNEILMTSKNYEELTYVWKSWRDATGQKIRSKFTSYIDLMNEAARANNFSNAAIDWLSSYIQDLPPNSNFMRDLEVIWKNLEPLYLKLHGYTRFHLRKYWGSSYVGGARDPIPAHLLGNMWAQSWSSILSHISPFPNSTSFTQRVDAALISQNYTVQQMFDLSNSFYTSLGLLDMSSSYNTSCNPEISSPENQKCFAESPMTLRPKWEVVCHASAWHMISLERSQYRIKMCTSLNYNDLITIHHEMGHIQYYMQYDEQPLEFQDGANNGFHEAIGDTLALSVQAPIHMKALGLLRDFPEGLESDLNSLLTTAMNKISFLPFGYLMDIYRWSLFNGSIDTSQMNYKWWELREKYQGIVPPVFRSEKDFDAASKYHTAANVPYIRYFISFVLQFQFYKELCLTSQQYDPNDSSKPLFKCDFSQGNKSRFVGEKLRILLKRGRSRPWPEILEEMTGSKTINSDAILEYFKPLSDWLDAYIDSEKIPIGWDSTFKSYFPS